MLIVVFYWWFDWLVYLLVVVACLYLLIDYFGLLYVALIRLLF